ncbi:hypothetical protein HDC30_002484 [Pseudomonas sp. JAI115]|uniref:hypothetical protein n=1 Tax=Pseudomonas sp. JAI115 TaxID=2723061 RepID=UPI00161BFB2E|nr:hypothetical protein [Pseudomonas sp. JAI115]MBB6155261.1 hypothetical protein [Pseudomonas sp. JAI115]
MNTHEQFVWEDVMKVCDMFNGLTQQGRQRLSLGLPAIANQEEQNRICTGNGAVALFRV